MLMKRADERDGNFVCRCCDGDIVLARNENGRRVFKCLKPDPNGKEHPELYECLVCRLPKSIWADDGTVCGNCALDFIQGQIQLTKEQIVGMKKWVIAIRV